MRVLLANTRHYVHGGDSSYTFALARALREAGHVVSFFAMQGKRNEPDPNEDLFASYIDFREINRSKGLASGLQVLRRSIFSSEASAKFSALLDRLNPDIVHLQNIHAHLTPSIIFVAARRGLPVVWTMHDYKVMCPNSHFRIDANGAICESCRPGRYYPAVARRCKKGSLLASGMAALEAYAHWATRVRSKVRCFISPSDFLAGKLRAHGWSAAAVRHVPNFVAAEDAHVREGAGSYFLFLGKLEPLKGIHVLAAAASAAPDSQFIVAGGCDDAAILESLKSAGPNVTYVGPRSAEHVAQLMAGARALVIPSVWYENQPMVILEAFAAGVPVIGSRIGGIPELVTSDRGLLVGAGEVGELARAIRSMDADPEGAVRMGRAAREYVLRAHSLQGHLQSILGIYQEAAAARAADYAWT